MSSLVTEKKEFLICGCLSSLSMKAIFMTVVVLLVGFKVQQHIYEMPPSLLFCWEETNPLINSTKDVTICDLNNEDDRFPNCQLPANKALVHLLEAHNNLEEAFSRVESLAGLYKSHDSKIFDSLAKHTEEVQESKAEIQKELDKDARKVRICDENETEEIFRLALFIILVDFLGLALDGFLTIASSGLVSTRFLL